MIQVRLSQDDEGGKEKVPRICVFKFAIMIADLLESLLSVSKN
jgi:hypothetical protein